MKFGGIYVFEELKEKNKKIKKGKEKKKAKSRKCNRKKKLIGISFILWPNSLEQLSS